MQIESQGSKPFIKGHKPNKNHFKQLPYLSNQQQKELPTFARNSAVAERFLLKIQKNQMEKELKMATSDHDHVPSNEPPKPLFKQHHEVDHDGDREDVSVSEHQSVVANNTTNDLQYNVQELQEQTQMSEGIISDIVEKYEQVENTTVVSVNDHVKSNLKNTITNKDDFLSSFNEIDQQLASFRVITEQEFEIMTNIKEKYKTMITHLQQNETALKHSQTDYEKTLKSIQQQWKAMASICEMQSQRLCEILNEQYAAAKEEIAKESQIIYNNLASLYQDMKQLKDSVSKPVGSLTELRQRSSVTQRLSQINLGSLKEYIDKTNSQNMNKTSNNNIRCLQSVDFDIKVDWHNIESIIKNSVNGVAVKNRFKAVEIESGSTSKEMANKNDLQLQNLARTSTMQSNDSMKNIKVSNSKPKVDSTVSKQLNNVTAMIEHDNIKRKIENKNKSLSSVENAIDTSGKIDKSNYHHTRASLSFDEELKEEFLKQWQNDDTEPSTQETSKLSSVQPIGNNINSTELKLDSKADDMIESSMFCFTRDGDVHECQIEIDVSGAKCKVSASKWNVIENEPEIMNHNNNNISADDASTDFFNSQLLHRTKYPAICIDQNTSKIYRFGGVLEGSQLSLSESFNCHTKLWNKQVKSSNTDKEPLNIYEELPIARQESLALQLNSDSIIVCGGAAKLPKNMDLSRKSMLLGNTRANAHTEWHFYDICDEFHVSSNQWNSTHHAHSEDSIYESEISSMNEARYAFSGVVIPGEYKAIVSGGNGPNGRVKTCEIYDRVKNEWAYLSDMPNVKARHGTCWYNSMNTMIVVGGDSKSNSKDCFAYDLEKNQWFGSMPKLNKEHDRAVVKCYEDKSILIVFGHNSKLTSFELLDGRIADSKWQISTLKNHPIDVDFRAGMVAM